MCGCPTGHLACNPGLCPDWESNRGLLVPQPALNPLSRTSQGKKSNLVHGSAKARGPRIIER